MNRENLKTITLVILISISIFLTFNIWTNNSDYETLPEDKFKEDNVILNVQKETSELIRPTQFFIHEKTEHYGTYEVELINKYWDFIRNLELIELRNEPDDFTSEQFIKWSQEIESEKRIEFIFSDEIPFEIFKSIFSFESTKQNINLSFDRIVIPIVKSNQLKKIYFVSYQNRLIYEATINQIEASEKIASFAKSVEDLSPFVSINTSVKRFLLPEKNIVFNEMNYLIDSIDGKEFKQILFNNLNNVQQETSKNQTVYTDGTKLLTVNSDLFRLSFLNTTINSSQYVDHGKVIEQSIDYINGHGGWTDQYHFFNLNSESKIVSFRLMINQLPVIEKSEGLAVPTAISLGWGENDIKSYYRPIYKLRHAFIGEKYELDSGKEIIAKLNKVENLSLDNIKRIFPGYEFSIIEDKDIVTLKPNWYIETEDGQLMKVSSENENS